MTGDHFLRICTHVAVIRMDRSARPHVDVVTVSMCIIIVIFYALKRFDDWCARLSDVEVATAARIMQHWRRDRRPEAAAWIRANKFALSHDLGDSVLWWLYCVDIDTPLGSLPPGDAPNNRQASKFLDLIARARAHTCTLTDIDSLWAIYFVTGDPSVVDLVREQVLCGREDVIEKVVWSIESVLGESFALADLPPRLSARIDRHRVMPAGGTTEPLLGRPTTIPTQ